MTDYFQCGPFRFDLRGSKSRPLVMGILNITPDSFSDGGRFFSLDAALTRAESMIAEGVDIIDIGGESTRPGASPVSLQEELDRVMPLVFALRDCGKPLSIDTYKPEVMREAISAGAHMINDINGFRSPGAIETVAGSDCGLCTMHMQRDPVTMQIDPFYDDVVVEVTAFLKDNVAMLECGGIKRERICIDPGFGFGKTLEHNLLLLKHIGKIQKELGLPLLAGLSRKSVIAALTGKSPEDRLAGNLAAALAAIYHGAHIVRVHEVAETVDAIKVWQAAQ